MHSDIRHHFRAKGIQDMSWLRGSHDLAYVLGKVPVTAGSGYQGDWITAGANLGAGAGKFVWYLRDKIDFFKDGLAKPGPLPTPTAIIDVAMGAISFVDWLNGFWAPDRGGAFSAGQESFDKLGLVLQLANPNPAEWDGDAAASYAELNIILQELATIMEELDKQAQQHVSDHAASVQKAHQVIALSLLALQVAQAAALIMWSWPVIGPGWSMAFQIMTVVPISLTVLGFENRVLTSSSATAQQFDALAVRYDEVIGRAKYLANSAQFSTIEVPGADESRTSDFQEISGSLSDFPGMPSIARLANLAVEEASPDERARQSAIFSDAGTLEERQIEVKPPAIDVTATYGQAAKLAQQVPQQMNLVNQAMGSVQQFTSRGQQGRGTAAPTEAGERAQAARVQDTAGAEAGWDAEGAERAPIDAEIAPEVKQGNRIR
jgi:hypothetical protein